MIDLIKNLIYFLFLKLIKGMVILI